MAVRIRMTRQIGGARYDATVTGSDVAEAVSKLRRLEEELCGRQEEGGPDATHVMVERIPGGARFVPMEGTDADHRAVKELLEEALPLLAPGSRVSVERRGRSLIAIEVVGIPPRQAWPVMEAVALAFAKATRGGRGT